MPLFCDNCQNLLTTITTDNRLYFQCKTCFKEFSSTPEDTLMLSVDLKESETFYKSETYINLSIYDNLSKLIKKKCQNEDCKEDIIKMITINDNSQYIYICPTCGFKFL
jgi:DNA-directed RNA polymerase subunit M/transcription elongation factor TFIIS